MNDIHITTTDARQRFEKVQRAIGRGHSVTVTDHGKPAMRITPISKRDKQAAADALRKLGLAGLKIAPRK